MEASARTSWLGSLIGIALASPRSGVSTTSYVLTVLGTVNLIYERDIVATLLYSYVNLWTTTDPYTQSTTATQLDEFRAYWDANMDGVPRHLSIHVGGLIITAAPLVEVVPLERATMPGRVVVQWDKDSVEDAGLVKIDLLALRTLGAIEEALAHIRAGGGDVPDLDHLPLDDPAVFRLLQRADTVGCVQVESRARSNWLKYPA